MRKVDANTWWTIHSHRHGKKLRTWWRFQRKGYTLYDGMNSTQGKLVLDATSIKPTLCHTQHFKGPRGRDTSIFLHHHVSETINLTFKLPRKSLCHLLEFWVVRYAIAMASTTSLHQKISSYPISLHPQVRHTTELKHTDQSCVATRKPFKPVAAFQSLPLLSGFLIHSRRQQQNEINQKPLVVGALCMLSHERIIKSNLNLAFLLNCLHKPFWF